jgi:HAD superfamily hydrolase (TIGR01549 family)
MQTHTYDAIVFDVLDTIYPWGPDKYSKGLDALCETVARRRPPATVEEVKARYVEIRTDYSAHYLTRLEENNFPKYVLEMVRLFGGNDCEDVAAEAVRGYNAAFASVLQLPEGVGEMFRVLSGRFKLGILSNYPTSGGIRQALERDGLALLLRSIVVSAVVGYIKPHPIMFKTICDELGCKPDRVLVVGDTWESDIVGAYLSGMPSVRIRPSAAGVEQGQFFNGHIRRWLDNQPDAGWKNAKPLAEFHRITELEPWLS